MEVITNPVCTNCYLRQVNLWLKKMNITTIPRNIILSKIKQTTQYETTNSETCILCNKEEITLCSYCFFAMSTRVLMELNFPEEIIQVFDAEFSYKVESEIL